MLIRVVLDTGLNVFAKRRASDFLIKHLPQPLSKYAGIDSASEKRDIEGTLSLGLLVAGKAKACSLATCSLTGLKVHRPVRMEQSQNHSDFHPSQRMQSLDIGLLCGLFSYKYSTPCLHVG